MVAEIAQAHEGSLAMAHAFIDAVASTGADAIKFQTHIAASESTRHEPWRVRLHTQDASRWAYWRRMEFTQPQWSDLKSHAERAGLIFLSTPFSCEAVDLLASLDLAAWKVSSGDVSNGPLLDRIAATGRPVLLSSGMSSMAELEIAVDHLHRFGLPLAVLQCSSVYPCPPERVGLNVLTTLRDRFGTDVGLSDHSGTIFPSLAAVALGCTVVEVHVTLSREMAGPDTTSSVTTSELKQLVDGVRFVQKAMNHPVDKDELPDDIGVMRSLFTKSVVTNVDLPSGTVLLPDHLALKRPGTGLPPGRLKDLIGRRLVRHLAADSLVSEADFE